MKNLFVFLIAIVSANISAQDAKIPQWFLDNVNQMNGIWVAGNSEFMSEQEPYESYINEWNLGIDNKSLTGKLYGKTVSGEKELFWEFRQYWDNESQEAVVLQFGNGNTIGQGKMYPVKGKKMESVQTFSLADGRTWVEKHESTIRPDTLVTTSFDQQSGSTWKKKRTYYWIKQTSLELGQFSMSLAVNDLQKSKEFYENLGFGVVDGKMEQSWLILKSNDIKIGLFKGLFPKNTITFSPTDARRFYQLLKKEGGTILFEQGMDKGEGACSFSFLDPDGNPILIDQH